MWSKQFKKKKKNKKKKKRNKMINKRTVHWEKAMRNMM